MILWIDEQRWLHGTLETMENKVNQDRNVKFCECDDGVSINEPHECKTSPLAIETESESPNKRIYDSNGIEIYEDDYDLTSAEIQEILGLDSLEISEILTRDDPPEDLLYLDQSHFQEVREIPDDVDEDTAWMLYYGDEIDEFNEYWNELGEGFSIYEHFGIYSDISDGEAEARLEAAIPDRG